MDASRCLLVPSGVTPDAAALAGPAALAYEITERALPRTGSEVAVVGVGLLGALVTAILASEACWTTTVDPDWERRLIGAMLGAAQSRDVGVQEPVSSTFETVGQTEALERALNSTRPGGTVVSMTQPLDHQEERAARRGVSLLAGPLGSGRDHLSAGLSLVARRNDWGTIASRAVPFSLLASQRVRPRGPEELAVLLDPTITTNRPTRFFRS